MSFAARIILCALVFLGIYCSYFWIVFWPEDYFIRQLVSLLPAMAAVVLAWRGSGAARQGVLMTAAYWAVVAGAVSFCVGFFGPMLLDPGANQGPLLGIFITGPLGFIVGGICGLIYALWHRATSSA
jgi:hypothetical protein